MARVRISVQRGGCEVQCQRQREERGQPESPPADQQHQGRKPAEGRQRTRPPRAAGRVRERLAGVAFQEEQRHLLGRAEWRKGLCPTGPHVRAGGLDLGTGGSEEQEGHPARRDHIHSQPGQPLPPRAAAEEFGQHRQADGRHDEHRRIGEQHGRRHCHGQGPEPAGLLPFQSPLDQQHQQQQGHEHVGSVGLGLGRIADERIGDGEGADRHQPRDALQQSAGQMTKQQQAGDRAEEDVEPQRILGKTADRDDGLLDPQVEQRRDLPVVQCPQQIQVTAIEIVVGEVGLVGPEGEVEEKADRADQDPQPDKGPGDPRQAIGPKHLGGGRKRIERREGVGRLGGRGLRGLRR